METLIPWSERYRPKESTSVIGNKLSFDIVQFFGKQNKHLLLHGLPGTGKSSSVRSLLKDEKKDSIFNFDSKIKTCGSLDKMTQQLTHFLNMKIESRVKYVIVDEIDSLPLSTQKIFTKPLNNDSETIDLNEKYVVFFFICNNLNQVSKNILQKCKYIRFDILLFKDVYLYLKNICVVEKIKYKKQILEKIYIDCDRDLRRVVLMLQQMNILHREVTENSYGKMMEGTIHINNYREKIESWVETNDVHSVTNLIYKEGYYIKDLVKFMLLYLKEKNILKKEYLVELIKSIKYSKQTDDTWFTIYKIINESSLFEASRVNIK
jgi:DNA polymerase III delta prime subunit